MRPSTTRAVVFALTGVAWPAMLVIVSLLWPGPVQPTVFGSPGFSRGAPSTLPPVDRSGSMMHVRIEYDPATASTTVTIDGDESVPASRIFWDIPASTDASASPGSAAPEGG